MRDDLRAAWRSQTGAKGLMAMLPASLALGTAATLAVGRAIYILLWQPRPASPTRRRLSPSTPATR